MTRDESGVGEVAMRVLIQGRAIQDNPWSRRLAFDGSRAPFVVSLLAALVAAGCTATTQQSPAPVEPQPTNTITVTSSPVVPPTLQDAYRAVQPAVVRIDGSGCAGFGSGTGFLVGRGVVATAAHVILDNEHGRITRARKASAYTVVALDEKSDIALLSVDSPIGGSPVEISTEKLSVGDAVATVGYSLGGSESFHDGVVNGLNRKAEIMAHDGSSRTAVGLIEHSAEALSGDSGAPLIIATGEVVGVHDAGIEYMAGQRLAVPASAVTDLLDGWDRTATSVLSTEVCDEVFSLGGERIDTTDFSSVEVDAWNTLLVRAEAINRADWAAAAAQYATSREPSDLEAGSAESQFTELLPLDMWRKDGRPVIWAQFQTTQPEGKGPKERPDETCTIWSVEYHFRMKSGLWLLTDSTPHRGMPTSEPCDDFGD